DGVQGVPGPKPVSCVVGHRHEPATTSGQIGPERTSDTVAHLARGKQSELELLAGHPLARPGDPEQAEFATGRVTDCTGVALWPPSQMTQLPLLGVFADRQLVGARQELILNVEILEKHRVRPGRALTRRRPGTWIGPDDIEALGA